MTCPPAQGSTAEALAALPARTDLRVRTALRQVFVTAADGHRDARPVKAEALSFKVLARPRRPR